MTVRQPIIEKADLWVVDPRKGVRWTERAVACSVSTTIIRVTDGDGAEGIAGVDGFTFGSGDRTTLEAVRAMWPAVEGRPIDCGPDLMAQMRVGVVFPFLTNAFSLVDTALWDLRAKHAGLPLWAFLAGRRDRVLAYASLETMPKVEDYVEVLGRASSEGFTAVKLHAFGDANQDIALYARLRDLYPNLILMHDAEGVYSREDALRVGTALAEMGCPWYEAPLPELDLDGYRELRRALSVPILPAGYALGDYHQVADALRDSPWTACRSEIASTHGITGLMKLMELAGSIDMDFEPVTYGSALYAMAGLHVVLAHENATYQEVAYPTDDWEYGVTNPLRPDAEGLVHAPAADGLGLTLDWDAIEDLTVYRAELTR